MNKLNDNAGYKLQGILPDSWVIQLTCDWWGREKRETDDIKRRTKKPHIHITFLEINDPTTTNKDI